MDIDDISITPKDGKLWKSTYKQMINDLGQLHSDVDKLHLDKSGDNEINDCLKYLKI